MRRVGKAVLPVLAVVVFVLAIFAIVATPDATAKGKPGGGGGGGGGGCPRTGIACTDVWDPVICSDGNVYSNACYAYVACATGCQPTDGGPVAQ